MLTDAYYTWKYGLLARRLGRAAPPTDHRQGFIIIQIDGLGYDHLMQAVAEGYMPYLRRLLTSGRMRAARWRCGLPSTTPAVQAGIMFGNRFDVPGFRWYEKEHAVAVSAKRPDQMRRVRERIAQGRVGILHGGSCYVSIFDGGADLALFTVSTFRQRRFFESTRGMGLFLLFLLSPLRVLRLARLTVRGYLAGLGRRLLALVRPGVLNPFDVLSPLLHAVGDALLTEVQTFGVLLDIYRRVPAIYANYNSYDEVAHKMGPTHRAAFRTLREIDRRIRQIDRMRTRYRGRRYALHILSDHGNSPATPFRWRTGMSLGEFVGEQAAGAASVDEQAHWAVPSADKARYMLAEWEGLERRLPPRLRRALTPLREHVSRRVTPVSVADYDLDRQQDIVVSASGPLAHIYLNISRRPLDLIEVVLLHPQMVDGLLGAEGVGAVIGRAGERTIVLGRDGGVTVLDAARVVVREPCPLTMFGEPDYVARQVHYLSHFPHSGDLIVLGAVGRDGRVVGFEGQMATHGGLGGAQGEPFIVWPTEFPYEPGALQDAQEMYAYFSALARPKG